MHPHLPKTWPLPPSHACPERFGESQGQCDQTKELPTSQSHAPALRTALRDLKDDASIRICKADKGSSVTILDSADYVRRGLEHLQDANTYACLDSYSSLRIQAKLNYMAVRRGWIAEDIAHACRRNPGKVKTQYIFSSLTSTRFHTKCGLLCQDAADQLSWHQRSSIIFSNPTCLLAPKPQSHYSRAITLFKGKKFTSMGKLDSRLYRKPCDSLAPLPYHLAHPPFIFKGIFMGEVTRLIRNTSDADQFARDLRRLANAFLERGYP